MGFRGPLEMSAIWNRCPPIEWLAKELLMVKKMNGNLLRIHVHAWENSTSEGINDPRIAELADQLGVMLIWITPSWIRTGNNWRQTVYPVDSSRLISLSSYLFHLQYGNDAGTIDYKGKPIKASWTYTAPMVTRGNQDWPTGYTSDWSLLRTWPDATRKVCSTAPTGRISILNTRSRWPSPTGTSSVASRTTNCPPTNGTTTKAPSGGNLCSTNGPKARAGRRFRPGKRSKNCGCSTTTVFRGVRCTAAPTPAPT